MGILSKLTGGIKEDMEEESNPVGTIQLTKNAECRNCHALLLSGEQANLFTTPSGLLLYSCIGKHKNPLANTQKKALEVVEDMPEAQSQSEEPVIQEEQPEEYKPARVKVGKLSLKNEKVYKRFKLAKKMFQAEFNLQDDELSQNSPVIVELMIELKEEEVSK